MCDIKEKDHGLILPGTARKKVLIALVVVALILSALFLWVGPVRIGEVIQNTLGQGPDNARDESGMSLVVSSEKDRIKIEFDDGYIEVVELIAGLNSTELTIHLEKVPALKVFSGYEGTRDSGMLKERLNDQLKQIYLRDEAGREYRYQDGNFAIEHTYCSACDSGDTWFSDVYLELPPLDPGAAMLTLFIPLPDGSEIIVDIPKKVCP